MSSPINRPVARHYARANGLVTVTRIQELHAIISSIDDPIVPLHCGDIAISRILNVVAPDFEWRRVCMGSRFHLPGHRVVCVDYDYRQLKNVAHACDDAEVPYLCIMVRVPPSMLEIELYHHRNGTVHDSQSSGYEQEFIHVAETSVAKEILVILPLAGA